MERGISRACLASAEVLAYRHAGGCRTVIERKKDLIKCPGGSYLIEREICGARKADGFAHCARCPENTDQLEMFETPLQVAARKKRGRRRRHVRRGGI